MDPSQPGLGFERKITFSLIGLIAGNIAMLFAFSLLTQAWQKTPGHVLSTFPFYVTSSLFGWVAVGLPAVLLTNTEFVARLNWLRLLLIGILLGLAALVIIFIVYGPAAIAQLGGFLYCWGFAALAACTASLLYVTLIRLALRAEMKNNRDLPMPQTPAFSLDDFLKQPSEDTQPPDFK
jgi:hypothetical protein